MSWQITQGSTTVTLPFPPQTNTDENPTVDDSTITIPEQGTILVSIGNDMRTLTMEGVFYIAGSNKTDHRQHLHYSFTGNASLNSYFSTPRPSLNSTWKFDKATFTETKDYAEPAIKFTFVFKFAANYLVL